MCPCPSPNHSTLFYFIYFPFIQLHVYGCWQRSRTAPWGLALPQSLPVDIERMRMNQPRWGKGAPWAERRYPADSLLLFGVTHWYVGLALGLGGSWERDKHRKCSTVSTVEDQSPEMLPPEWRGFH